MPKYKITYTFEEEMEYADKGEAQLESDQLAEGVGDGEELTVVSVKVEEC
jgi:hypothetical protein